jgi:hypothetical protein
MADRTRRDRPPRPDHDEEIPPGRRGFHPADRVEEPAQAPDTPPGVSDASPSDTDSPGDSAHPQTEKPDQQPA